jgi:site-specific DNA-methyltransferase (adenine-specific)
MIGYYKLFNNVSEIKDTVHAVVTSPPYYHQRKYGDSDLEIGRESTPREYAKKLSDVFDAIPLHKLGSLWVNLGDKRNSDGGLMATPEIFMIEMLNRGWLLLDKVVWSKIVDFDDGTTVGGCMTEPAEYRLNSNGHEFLYRFAKTKNAWSDVCAVSIPRQQISKRGRPKIVRYMPKELMNIETSIEGRCLHNVWRTEMGQTKEKHYAVYPTTLCERPIAMTCPLKVCKTCDHLETRLIDKVAYDEGRGSKRVFGKYKSIDQNKDMEENKNVSGRMDTGRQYIARKPVTIGWTKCNCKPLTWENGVVLDPFCGSGTTGEVALKLGRSFIGVDIYKSFLSMTEERCEKVISYLNENKIDPWILRR